jgi:hypothetical protein
MSAIDAMSAIDEINQTDLSRLSCLPHETLFLFHWGSESVRGEMHNFLLSHRNKPKKFIP